MNSDDEKPRIEVSLQPESRNRKTMLIGIAVLVFAGVSFVGVIYAAYNYLDIGTGDSSVIEAASISDSATGIPGLDKWNIEGQSLGKDELRQKYLELYNYTYPFLLKEAIKSEIIPSGVPEIYGEELSVSFDGAPNQMIRVLRSYEDSPLDETQMARYKDVGLRIACEYCCSAKALIREDGSRACGCAHSFAMRGLAKYLIINHPDEYSNDEILLELGKWKATYFPKQTISKAVYKYAEFGNIDPSVLTEMPNMVGSC
ncbi:MAG TPA: hypothetical protein ENH13_06145 [Euryarchaeota archaeon]|nr:hypothetical protein BMS3Bbin16_01140 [archaeon BMS3Bbin16]HDH28695.1 hypothetical protein [Euryarchaeota archaeon]